MHFNISQSVLYFLQHRQSRSPRFEHLSSPDRRLQATFATPPFAKHLVIDLAKPGDAATTTSEAATDIPDSSTVFKDTSASATGSNPGWEASISSSMPTKNDEYRRKHSEHQSRCVPDLKFCRLPASLAAIVGTLMLIDALRKPEPDRPPENPSSRAPRASTCRRS